MDRFDKEFLDWLNRHPGAGEALLRIAGQLKWRSIQLICVLLAGYLSLVSVLFVARKELHATRQQLIECQREVWMHAR